MSQSPAQRGPLPLMKTLADAEALWEKEEAPNYPDAFRLEAWFGNVALKAATEYAE